MIDCTTMIFAVLLIGVLPTLIAGCGQRPAGSRVINGQDAAPHSWPWQVSLRKKGFHSCGGTLIRPDWVLTAAHCVFKNPNKAAYSVVVGAHNRYKVSDVEETFKVRTLIVYPDYSPRILRHDIALIQLRRPVALSDKVNVACLPSKHATVGDKCYLTGWGIDNKGDLAKSLQQAVLPIVSQTECRKKYYVEEGPNLCAGYGRSDTGGGCNGDSGGPLVCKENGRWVIHGAVSFGKKYCPTTAYTVFSRVYTYIDWIKLNIGGGGPSPPTGQPPVPSTAPPTPPLPPQTTTPSPGGCTDRWGSRWCKSHSCNMDYVKKACAKTCKLC